MAFIGHVKASIAALTSFLACSECGGTNPGFAVYVDPPADETSCIGVVGFEVTVTSGTRNVPSGPLLGLGPVLESSGCRIARPFAVDAVALDGMLTVTVVGYDSGLVARVVGSGTSPRLGADPLHVPLAPMPGATANVLVINRTALLGGASLADVATMVISTVRMPADILTVNAVQAGAYFSGVEPGAFGIDGVPPPDLTATFTVSRGTAPQRVKLTATQQGNYWRADPP